MLINALKASHIKILIQKFIIDNKRKVIELIFYIHIKYQLTNNK